MAEDDLNDSVNTCKDCKEVHKPYRVKPLSLGHYSDLDYDNIGTLLEYAEGPAHK